MIINENRMRKFYKRAGVSTFWIVKWERQQLQNIHVDRGYIYIKFCGKSQKLHSNFYSMLFFFVVYCKTIGDISSLDIFVSGIESESYAILYLCRFIALSNTNRRHFNHHLLDCTFDSGEVAWGTNMYKEKRHKC